MRRACNRAFAYGPRAGTPRGNARDAARFACAASGVTVDGDVKAGIGTIDLGQLGKVKVNTDIEGSLGVRASARQVAVAAEASFSFHGEDMQIARFALDTRPDTLVHLADTLKSKAEALIRDEFKDSTRWANAVKSGAVDGVTDTEKVLKNVYGKSDKDAKAVASGIAGGFRTAAKTSTRSASKFGKKLKKVF